MTASGDAKLHAADFDGGGAWWERAPNRIPQKFYIRAQTGRRRNPAGSGTTRSLEEAGEVNGCGLGEVV